MDKIVSQQWMLLTSEIRKHLAIVFDIPRTGISEIRDQTVISDGHTTEDLSILTIKLLCEYVGSEETFGRAWELACAKAYYELHPPEGVIVSGKVEPVEKFEEVLIVDLDENVKRKAGRPKKQS